MKTATDLVVNKNTRKGKKPLNKKRITAITVILIKEN